MLWCVTCCCDLLTSRFCLVFWSTACAFLVVVLCCDECGTHIPFGVIPLCVTFPNVCAPTVAIRLQSAEKMLPSAGRGGRVDSCLNDYPCSSFASGSNASTHPYNQPIAGGLACEDACIDAAVVTPGDF